jgi:hypothetical protein
VLGIHCLRTHSACLFSPDSGMAVFLIILFLNCHCSGSVRDGGWTVKLGGGGRSKESESRLSREPIGSAI